MKKTLLTLIFLFSIPLISFSQTLDQVKQDSREKISGGIENVNELFCKVLPENSSLLSLQPDSYIGKLFPSLPMHFTLGTSFSGTFIRTEKITDSVKLLSEGISDTLNACGATESINVDFTLPKNIPLPTAAFTARIGGIILPFDLGLYGMTTFNFINNITVDDAEFSVEYSTFGFDLRYAVYQGNILLPKISIGAGYNYSKVGLDFATTKHFTANASYELDGKTSSAGYEADLTSDVSLSTSMHTIFLEAQVSKKLLVFEPYIGTKVFFTKTICDYDWKYNTVMENKVQEKLSDSDSKSETSNFGENVSTQFFGGVGITLLKFQIALNGAYNAKTDYWSCGVGFNLKI